jgi:glycerophosphoryl diester phosphodiesterase
MGVDAVEPDIVATSDGVLVVRHENEISGTTDVAERTEFAARRTTKVVDGEELTGWFTEDFTWAELATLRCRERLPKIRTANCAYDGTEPILRLRDVLELVDQQSRTLGRAIRVVVEIKHDQYFRELGVDLVELMLTELADTGWLDRPELLIIESFELATILRLRAVAQAAFVEKAELIFLAESSGAPADEVAAQQRDPTHHARDYAWFRSNDGLDLLAPVVHGISVSKRNILDLDAEGGATGVTDFVQRAHDRGLRVYTWTLRPENKFLNQLARTSDNSAEWGNWQTEFALVLDSGVDGVFVDHPDLGLEARASRG